MFCSHTPRIKTAQSSVLLIFCLKHFNQSDCLLQFLAHLHVAEKDLFFSKHLFIWDASFIQIQGTFSPVSDKDQGCVGCSHQKWNWVQNVHLLTNSILIKGKYCTTRWSRVIVRDQTVTEGDALLQNIVSLSDEVVCMYAEKSIKPAETHITLIWRQCWLQKQLSLCRACSGCGNAQNNPEEIYSIC